MKIKSALVFLSGFFLIAGCSSVRLPVKNQYQLVEFSAKRYPSQGQKKSLLIAVPDAVAAYQTNEMIYINQPYKLSYFAHNAWSSPPADMLYPLIMQSIQKSHVFYAVASSPYAEQADYRLNVQLLKFEQNFLKKPAVFDLSLKAVVTDIEGSRALASNLINISVPCPSESPYGGVVAANQAVQSATGKITAFVIQAIKQDKRIG